MYQSKFFIFLFAVSSLFWSGCASTNSNHKSQADYKKEMRQLLSSIKKNPKNAAAWRDLSVICYEMDMIPHATKFITKAYRLNPNDAQTLYYVGLLFEKREKPKQAIRYYKKYSKVSRLSPYRRKMEGRYQLLTRQLVQQDMRKLIKQEDHLSLNKSSEKTIAVFPLQFKGNNKKYAALGRGISEMMITDLSQVPDLQMVERVRLQALFKEMALGQTGLTDKGTLARTGKVLGAGKILNGSYDLFGKNKLQMDVAFWDVYQGTQPTFARVADALPYLFRLEKEIVFAVINNMGIELTPQQREKIQRIPTKSMQAFFAYCQGLEMEDNGQFAPALQFYQKANVLDPNYYDARRKLENSEAIVGLEGGIGDDYATTGLDQSRMDINAEEQDLLTNRLQNLSNSIGSIFIPGQDNRESAEDAQNSGVDVFDDLPLPPAPPERK